MMLSIIGTIATLLYGCVVFASPRPFFQCHGGRISDGPPSWSSSSSSVSSAAAASASSTPCFIVNPGKQRTTIRGTRRRSNSLPVVVLLREQYSPGARMDATSTTTTTSSTSTTTTNKVLLNNNNKSNAHDPKSNWTTATTTTPTTTDTTTSTKSNTSIHLVSLPPKNDSFLLPGESLLRECWKWKDVVLGDGRDYFVPKPKALRSFHSLFVGMEVAVFSNCVGVDHDDDNDNDDDNENDGGGDGGDDGNLAKMVLKMPCSSGENGELGARVVVTLPLLSQQHQHQHQQDQWNGVQYSSEMNNSNNDKNNNNTTNINNNDNNNMSQQQQPEQGGLCKTTFVIEECAALSNCARLDVILVLRSLSTSASKSTSTTNAAAHAARYAVAYHLQQQILHSQQRSNNKSTSLLQRMGLASWFDLPDAVVDTQPPTLSLSLLSTNDNAQQQQPQQNQQQPQQQQSQQQIIATATTTTTTTTEQVTQLQSRLTSLQGAPSISSHLCLIAGGLAPRPNRPDRAVVFRPYSSRDAHILLQLKRTVEVISSGMSSGSGGSGGNNSGGGDNDGGSRGGRIKTLLDGALSAGKAVRNENVVPEIRKLKEYGSDGTPPQSLANAVGEAAIERGVKPSVASCIARLTAMETADQISQMRMRVNDIVASLIVATTNEQQLVSISSDTNTTKKMGSELQKLANGLLHVPTMRLREGRNSISDQEVDDIVLTIEKQLKDYYSCHLLL